MDAKASFIVTFKLALLYGKHMVDTTRSTMVPKILAPIRSYRGAVRVIEAGADEIYCGIRTPGLEDFELYRGASCDIPTYDEFRQITEHAHRHGVKVLVTVNQPFIVDSIEDRMAKHIQICVDAGADTLILGDLGMLQLVKQIAPQVHLCASTYLATMNQEGEKYYLSIFDRFFGDVVDSEEIISYLSHENK